MARVERMASKKVTSEMLIAYAIGELSPDAALVVETHVAESPSAAARLERIRSAIQSMRTDDSTAPSADAIARAKAVFRPLPDTRRESWWNRLERVVAVLVFDGRAQPARAGYRGGEGVVQLSYESDAADVDLELVPPASADESTWTLMGQIAPHAPTVHLTVALVSQSGAAASVEVGVDEQGMFTLRSDPGTFDLMIRVGDKVIVLPDVRLA